MSPGRSRPVRERRAADGNHASVLIAIDHLGGGTGNHLLSLVEPLQRHGIRTAFHCFGEIQARDGVPSYVTFGPPPRRFVRYPIAQLRQFVHFRSQVLESAPDALHSVFFWPIIYGRLLKAAGAVRALVESREDQGFNWGRHEYALLRLTRRLPDRIICVSEAVRRVMLEREAVEPQRTTVVHNGIDLPTAGASKRSETRRALGFGPDDFVVGMVANLNRAVKGVGYFVSAMPGILGAVPSARFLIVGGGPDEAALRTQAERLGVEDRVRFAGFQSEVASYYDAMDISVLTSLSEGLSITLLESMGRGLPVVVTRVGGNPEVVRDGETGFLVPARDVEAFTARVVALARDPSLRLRLGNAGRATITRSFSRADAAARYARVYEEVLR